MGRHEAQKAFALDPVSLAAQTNVAIIYYRAGRYDEAVGEARRVLDLETTYAHAHYVLGRAYVQKGRYREAILSSRRAVALEGSNVRYMASLAYIYESQESVATRRSSWAKLSTSWGNGMCQLTLWQSDYAGLGVKDKH
jgi:tetratricopeptide (TPR) repeat protein